MEESYN